MKDFAEFVAAIVGGLGLSLIVMSFVIDRIDHRLHRLDQRVSCLEHPHGASSTAVQLKPNFRVIQPATRTGCTP